MASDEVKRRLKESKQRTNLGLNKRLQVRMQKIIKVMKFRLSLKYGGHLRFLNLIVRTYAAPKVREGAVLIPLMP
ncbi:hypothetical protein JXM67_11960 [candidate division WOR-3 bacterium]|nr:hypothetical protein [candidate division WOR-3 bacterium]